MNVKVNESGCCSLSGVVVFSGASLVLVEVEFPGTVCSVEGDVFRLDGGFVMVVDDFRMVVLAMKTLGGV